MRRGRGVGRYRRLGSTLDDAVGEAFDKVGKLLGLPWPGGPALERLARQGDPSVHPLPRPMLGRPGCDFSFSGLKTAVAQLVDRFPAGPLPAQTAADIAAGFQAAVAEVLADRAARARHDAGGDGAGGGRRRRGQRRRAARDRGGRGGERGDAGGAAAIGSAPTTR